MRLATDSIATNLLTRWPRASAWVSASANEMITVELVTRRVINVKRDYVATAPPERSGEDGGIELLEVREAVEGKATAYVCRGFACERPVAGAEELEGLLG